MEAEEFLNDAGKKGQLLTILESREVEQNPCNYTKVSPN